MTIKIYMIITHVGLWTLVGNKYNVACYHDTVMLVNDTSSLLLAVVLISLIITF